MKDNKTKETSIPIDELNKLSIKDDKPKPKPTEQKSGGLKDLLNNNNNQQANQVNKIKKKNYTNL
jgi:hypothetical protein